MSQDSGEEGSAAGAPKAGVPPEAAAEAKAEAKVDAKPDEKKGSPDDKPDVATAEAKVEVKTDEKATLDAKAPGSPTPTPTVQSATDTADDKPVEAKKADDKPAEAKKADDKPVETKKADDKPVEAKKADDKPAAKAEAKKADDKPVETKKADDKPAAKAEAKKADDKPAAKKADDKPAAKKADDKPAKSKPAEAAKPAAKPAPAPAKPAAPAASAAAAAGGDEGPTVQKARIPRGGAIEVVATPVEIVLRVLSMGMLSGAMAARGLARFLESFAPKSDYPDDGRVSRELRTFDRALGTLEQFALFAIFAAVVIVAATHAILDRFFHHPIAVKEQVIRGGTFAIAMLGGAFATHQARHLSMDLVSRRLSPRARLYLKIFLACFTIGIVALMVRALFSSAPGRQPTMEILQEQAASGQFDDKLITPVMTAWMVPIGGILIIVHTLVHTAIDVDYLIRRKTPPERMRAH